MTYNKEREREENELCELESNETHCVVVVVVVVVVARVTSFLSFFSPPPFFLLFFHFRVTRPNGTKKMRKTAA